MIVKILKLSGFEPRAEKLPDETERPDIVVLGIFCFVGSQRCNIINNNDIFCFLLVEVGI